MDGVLPESALKIVAIDPAANNNPQTKKPKKKGEKASKLLLCRRVPKGNEKVARSCSTKRHNRSIVNWIFDRLEDTRVARQGTSKQRLNIHGVASVLE